MANLFIRIFSTFSGKGFDEGKKEAKSFRNELSSLAREMGAGIGLGLVLNEIKDFTIGSVLAAEQGRSVARTFTNLSGSAAQAAENMEAMRAATRNLITETEQQQIANKLLGMNIVQTADQLEEVIGVSRRLGKEFKGLGAREAADEFAIMIANMSYARLDSFAISSGTVRQRVQELMKTTQGMTQEQAFFLATMEEARKTLEKLGPEIETTTDRVAELGARWGDFQGAFGELLTGEEVGTMDLIVTQATIFVEKLTEGARAWRGFFNDLAVLDEKVGGALSAINRQILHLPDFSLIFKGATERIAAEAQEAQAVQEQANNEGKQAEEEQVDELADIKREFAGEILDIQRATNDQLADEALSFTKEQENLEEDHADTLTDIRKRSGKQLVKMQRDLQKDLAKEDTDLKKDLAKLEQDQGKKVTEFQTKSATDEKRQRKLSKIDALADERLFQFELRQLAAEGEGNAIKAALERRAIEEEIAKEKAGVEQEIESEKAQETIDTIRQEGDERRAQLQLDNQERKTLLEERHTEEVAELNEQLAEQVQAENESFAERKGDLQEHYDDRLAEIKEGEAEAIAEVGEALTQTDEMTTEKLSQLTPIARAIGEETGKQFAEGILAGYQQNQKIDQLLGTAAKGGIQPISAAERETIEQLSGVPMFQNEGIVRGRVGVAHRGEVVLNPGGGSLGGGIIQIGGEQFITSHAARLAAVINAQRQADMQMLVDQLANMMD